MFIEKDKQRFAPQISWTVNLGQFFSNPKNRRRLVGVLLLLAALGFSFIYLMIEANKRRIAPTPSAQKPNNTLPSLGKLDNGQATSTAAEPLQAENLFFGNFYRPSAEAITAKASGIKLPVNIKEAAANYYPFNREINLNDYFTQINQNGFVVIDNPWPKEATDFFGIYKIFNSRNLPFLLTKDFLLYYYQNAAKNIYHSIEAEVFYKEFWEINKAMFELADKHYRDRYDKVGILNDPVLEGLRLEAVYFATALEILKPKTKQILAASKESVSDKELDKKYFAFAEAQQYNFTPPAYLKDTIAQELVLIERGLKNPKPVRSPALLYVRDYREFNVPKEYGSSAKSNNFYLASIWANSLFPLFYQNDNCPDCLLDKDDWLINQTAAQLLARDFSLNQDLKNRWAKIYKVMSFFNNMRSELTYLQYHQVFTDLFGPSLPAGASSEVKRATKDVEDVFDLNNEWRGSELGVLQSKLAALNFDPAKGAYDRVSDKKIIGMRMLQTSFDPSKYVYDQLLYDQVGPHNNYNFKVKDKEIITGCALNQSQMVRCRAFGLDIINAVFNEPITTSFFVKNTDYQSYGNQAPLIRNHFNQFDEVAWHNNLYWSTLDINRKVLNNRQLANFPYSQNAVWTEVNLRTALGALTNAQLPADVWSPSFKQSDRLVTEDQIVKYNYIEPDLTLINELLANSQMLFEMLINLDLVKRNHNEFNQLISDLQGSKNLIVKELAGEDFLFADWSFLNELVSRYTITAGGQKSLDLEFAYPGVRSLKGLTQTNDGIKILIVAQHHQGRNILLGGPIFNFREISD